MWINRVALFVVVAASTSSSRAQTMSPTPAATQVQGTPAPTSLATVVQGTPAPTPAGTSATTTMTPTTMAPTTEAPVVPTTNSPTRSLGRSDCNICGEGTENMIGEPNAVVNYPDPDEPETMRRFPCQEVQNLVNRRNVYFREDVCQYIFTYTFDTCRCTTPEGDLLSDVLVPTIAPANGGEPQDGPTAGGDGDGSGNDGEDGDSGATSAVGHILVTLLVGAAAAFTVV